MTPALVRQRCTNHAAREAVCRCPGCSRYFCRECVTDHDGRLLCSRCLRGSSGEADHSASWKRLLWTAGALAGMLFAWGVFYWLGALLARMPASFQGVDQ